MSEKPTANPRDVEIHISLSLKQLTDKQKTKLGDRRWFEREEAIHEVSAGLAAVLSQHYEIRCRPTRWEGPRKIWEGMK